VAVVARKFMHDRHAESVPRIKARQFWLVRNNLQYLRCNFNYEALGIAKANTYESALNKDANIISQAAHLKATTKLYQSL
jgi:hypothetical protein